MQTDSLCGYRNPEQIHTGILTYIHINTHIYVCKLTHFVDIETQSRFIYIYICYIYVIYIHIFIYSLCEYRDPKLINTNLSICKYTYTQAH